MERCIKNESLSESEFEEVEFDLTIAPAPFIEGDELSYFSYFESRAKRPTARTCERNEVVEIPVLGDLCGEVGLIETFSSEG